MEKNVEIFALVKKQTPVASNYESILKKRTKAFSKKDRTQPGKIECRPPEKRRHPAKHSKIAPAATGDPQVEAARAGSSRVEMLEARGYFVRCFFEPARAGSSRLEVRLQLAENGGKFLFQFGEVRAGSSRLELAPARAERVGSEIHQNSEKLIEKRLSPGTVCG